MSVWPEMTVEQVCSRIIDYRGKTPIKTPHGIRLITAKVVKGGEIRDEPAEYIAEDSYDEWMSRGLPQQWDVLITTEAPLGETALIRTNGRVALGQRLILLRGDPNIIDQRYLLYELQSAKTQAHIAARATGTTVLGIKQSELRQVLISIPPLRVQRRIASILGAYDDLIEINRRRIALLEEMARRLFEEWFVHFRFPGHEENVMVDTPDGSLPEGWRLGVADELIEFEPKTAVAKDGLKPFIPMSSLSTDSSLTGEIEWREGNSGAKFSNGDTLFARIAPCLENGKTGLVRDLPDGELDSARLSSLSCDLEELDFHIVTCSRETLNSENMRGEV